MSDRVPDAIRHLRVVSVIAGSGPSVEGYVKDEVVAALHASQPTTDRESALEEALVMAMDFEAMTVGEVDDKYGRERADKGWLDSANVALARPRRVTPKLTQDRVAAALRSVMDIDPDDNARHVIFGRLQRPTDAATWLIDALEEQE